MVSTQSIFSFLEPISRVATCLAASAALAFASSTQDGRVQWPIGVRAYRQLLKEVSQVDPRPGDELRARHELDWDVGDERGPIVRIVWKEQINYADAPSAGVGQRLIETFDARGSLVEEVWWSFGELDGKRSYVLDSERRVLEILEEDATKPRTSKSVFSYGDSGKLLSTLWSIRLAGKWQPAHRTDYEYDEAGRLVRERRESIGSSSGKGFIDDYQYSAAGQLASKTVREADGAPVSCVRYAFDSRGMLATVLQEYPSGRIERHFLDEDQDGRPERQVHEVEGRAGKTESTLDREGRLMGWVSLDLEGRPAATMDRVYDDGGLVVSQQVRDVTSGVVERTTRVHERDSHGNVVAILESTERVAEGTGLPLGTPKTRSLAREIEYAPATDRR